MKKNQRERVAILYPGNEAARATATPTNNRFASVFQALSDLGVQAEPAVYHDDFCTDVCRQLLQVDGVLVWVNPLNDGRDRSVLDAMLCEVSKAGVLVSAHPDVIAKMGTKEVVYRTRDIGWGCDTHLYSDFEELRRALPARLAAGAPRVLKQCRGNGGIGVWKVELADEIPAHPRPADQARLPQPDTLLRVRQAKRGSFDEEISLEGVLSRFAAYFSANGKMLDQAYQPRLAEGMIRCYLVQAEVAGFGHQAVNAFYPAPPGAPADAAPEPGPRLYHPATMPDFQLLKRKLEQEWVPAMQRLLDIDTDSLPMLWDCDFLLGPRTGSGEDTHVLCEINASSVAPFPDSAVPVVALATVARIQAANASRVAQ